MNLFSSLITIVALLLAVGVRAEDSPGNANLFARLDANSDGSLAADEIAQEHQRLFKRLLRTGDKNEDGRLSQEEFAAALTPSRPEKPLEQKQDADNPGARATKWLLLTLDSNKDSRLVENEIPDEYLRVFDRLVEQIDRDDDGVLNIVEIFRGGPQITRQAVQVARQRRINIDRELAQFTKQQGDEANRFDERPPDPQQALNDPRSLRRAFARLDANKNGSIELDELPQINRDRLERPFRRADANRDGKLSQEEYATLSRRLATFGAMTDRPNRPNNNRPRPNRPRPEAN